MKYTEFRDIKNLREKLLTQLGIFGSENLIVKINHYPDYDMTEYQGSYGTDYVFKSSWQFPMRMQSVSFVSTGEMKIYHFDDLKRMSADSDIAFFAGQEEQFINRVFDDAPELLEDYGIEPTELDDFKLNHIRVSTIDNERRKINYEGTFFGDSIAIDPIDWAVYVHVNIAYIPADVSNEFYAELIGESLILLDAEKINLFYFLLFSAFESFVNSSLDVDDPERIVEEEPREKDRLKSKVKLLFTRRFGNITGHQVYNSLMPSYTRFKENRNVIAHGKGRLILTGKEVQEALLFTLIMILSYREKAARFDELKEILQQDHS